MQQQKDLTTTENNVVTDNSKVILSSRKAMVYLALATVCMFIALFLYINNIYGTELLPGSDFTNPNGEQQYSNHTK